MEMVAVLLSFLALAISAVSLALHARKSIHVTFLNVGDSGVGEVIFRRLGQIDNRGTLRFSTDGDSIVLPTAELQNHPGELAWVLVALRHEET